MKWQLNKCMNEFCEGGTKLVFGDTVLKFAEDTEDAATQ